MYQVLIIEDDPMVASIDRKYVEMTPGFQVLDTIPDGSRALDSPLLAKADLIILDYFMPRMNGDEFIDRMHHAGHTPSVIMVTSANDSGIVTSLLSRGVTDYLVKPFEYDRFRDALLRFERQNRQRNCSRDSFDQEEIDRLIRGGGLEKPSTKPPEELAKGLNETVNNVILVIVSLVLFSGGCRLCSTNIKPLTANGMPLIAAAILVVSISLLVFALKRIFRKK